MILLTALALASCRQEEELEFAPAGEIGQEEVAFKIGSVATRSAVEADAQVNTLTTVKVGESTLTLDETVTSLDYVYDTPGTRGTPAFTENVATLYGTFNAVANPNSTDATTKLADAAFPFNSSTTYWAHDYGRADIWSKAPYTFFMRMPADVPGVTIGTDNKPALTYGNDGSISFSYVSPETASAQKDILFTSTTLSGKEENGKTITFYHALTGVKFANFFDYSLHEGAYAKAETIIKSVTVKGINNSGKCVVTPSNGVGDGKNSATASIWTDQSGSAEFTQSIAHDFADYSKSGYDLSPLETTASKQNLNDNNASLTFWFVPQDIPAGATITVVFDVSLKTLDDSGNVTGTETTFTNKTLTINLHDALAEGHRTWKAGELHTFTLWPTAVGVKITDTMNEANTEKKDVVVKNTGNTWQYVRVNIVGNWVGQVTKDAKGNVSNPTILMGYKYPDGTTTFDDGEDIDTETEPWNDKDGYTKYGTFVNLVPKSKTTAPTIQNNWVRYDKYYYYIKAIGPNDAITEPIFDSYTVAQTPNFYIADLWGIRRLAQNVHLEMDLMVEAIEAPTDAEGNLLYPDGTLIGDNTDGYLKAWVAALGLDQVSDLDDLK